MLASYEEYLQDGGHPGGNNNQAKGLQDTPIDHTINPVRSISVLLKNYEYMSKFGNSSETFIFYVFKTCNDL